MSYLVLVRHGKSEWNEKGLWTGWTDIPLVESGILEAKRTGEELQDIKFDYAYSSALIRAKQTLEEIFKVTGQSLPIIESKALNERNYGDYTGKNKWEVKKEIGEEEFKELRRGWNYPIPNGESLKEVFEREIPYFQDEIEPKLKNGKNVIIASSGNALRAIVKYLEDISEEEIAGLEIGTGEAFVYEVDESGRVVNKEIRGKNESRGKV